MSNIRFSKDEARAAALTGADAVAMLWRAGLPAIHPDAAPRSVQDILRALDLSDDKLSRYADILYSMAETARGGTV